MLLLLRAGLGRGQPIKIIFWLIMKIIIAAVSGKKKCWAGEADLHLPRTLSGPRSAIPLHRAPRRRLQSWKVGLPAVFSLQLPVQLSNRGHDTPLHVIISVILAEEWWLDPVCHLDIAHRAEPSFVTTHAATSHNKAPLRCTEPIVSQI